MQTDACGICNGNNNTATFVSNSLSQVVNSGTNIYIVRHTFTCSCLKQNFICIGYNDVSVIPADARHVNIMDDGTSGNDVFIGI